MDQNQDNTQAVVEATAAGMRVDTVTGYLAGHTVASQMSTQELLAVKAQLERELNG